MGKASPKEVKTPKQRRRSRASNNPTSKYLRPGALAQLRYNKAASSTNLGKKRIVLSDSKKVVDHLVIANKVGGVDVDVNVNVDATPKPERFVFSSNVASPLDLIKQNVGVFDTPKTPRFQECDSESRLESLPMDLLVKVFCHLHHDQLKAVFHVSRRSRMAVILARQFYFNYTTPDRSRQEMLSTMTPLATEHWPFVSKGEGKGMRLPSPHTPKAPRHGPRPPSQLKYTEMRQVAAALFQEASLPVRCMVPSLLNKPICKNRVLFNEDELCQAVAQNKLR